MATVAKKQPAAPKAEKADKTAGKAAAPAKQPAKQPAAAKEKAEASTRGRKSAIDPNTKLSLLVKENPKREGCAAYERFNAYFTVKTVAEALAAGLTRKDLAWDIAHGHISVK
jgi:hypothetical protein